MRTQNYCNEGGGGGPQLDVLQRDLYSVKNNGVQAKIKQF